MQQSPLLQPFALRIDVPSPQSKAESEASQREFLKPSECKVGDVFYRYESHLVSAGGVDEFDESLGSYMALYCMEYEVEQITKKGAKVMAHDKNGDWGSRPVLDHYINKFAYPTKAEALLGFIARKRRQQSIITGQLSRSKQAQSKAEQLLAKELENVV